MLAIKNKRIITIAILLTAIISTSSTETTRCINSLDNSPFMNTKFLKNHAYVCKTLITEHNFEELFFTSSDGTKINALLRTHKQARGNIILLAGWYPGKKEGIASLVPMIDEKLLNILLVDIRYHGKSDGGSTLFNIGNFGMHEYKDVIAAIEFLKDETGKPTFVWGTCAGAFHAAHALIKIEQEKRTQELNVVGLIFDSGWASPSEATIETSQAFFKDFISPSCISKPLTWILCSLRSMLLDNRLKNQAAFTGLYDKIDQISVPIFYIHARNDERARFEHVKQLYEKTQNKRAWWIEKSKHACLHLKHKHEYQNRLLDFCLELVSEQQG